MLETASVRIDQLEFVFDISFLRLEKRQASNEGSRRKRDDDDDEPRAVGQLE